MKITEANTNKNEAKFKFHGQSVRYQCWFDLDFNWIEEILAHVKLKFLYKIFQRHDKTQDTNKFKMFQVPIRNSKCVEEIMFHSKSSVLKHCQK